MDLISQATLGALFAQTQASTKQLGKALVIGALAGMSADLDVLIRSANDPLLFLDFHRYFTHSLLFIPLGGLICSLVFYPLLAKRWQLRYTQILLWCIIGFATHGLLDSCTTYGTQLLWPFSNVRFAWSTISIIDPLFTLPLLFFIILAYRKKSKIYIKIALFWMIFYLTWGFIQHQNVLSIGKTIAEQRGHYPVRIKVQPSFGNLIVWKVIYEYDGYFYVDAVKPNILTPVIWQGDKIAKLNIKKDFSWLNKDSQQALDIQRFRHFSNDFLAVDPQNPNRIVDMRYSLLPNTIAPLWGIELSRHVAVDTHVSYSMSHRNRKKSSKALLKMIFDSNNSH